MAKRIFTNQNWIPTATADTLALTNATYMALKGGSATQINNIVEARISGLAAASAPSFLNLALASTIETTPTALAAPASDGPAHPATAALAAAPISYTAAGTGPQRAATVTSPKVNLALNTFGGIIRYNMETIPFTLIGNTVALFGIGILSAFTGGSGSPVVSADLVYEPL